MRRWHKEQTRTINEWKRHVSHAKEYSYEPISIGHFRKRKSLSCGRSRCQLCHSYKFPKRKLTKQEMLVILKQKESIKDVGI